MAHMFINMDNNKLMAILCHGMRHAADNMKRRKSNEITFRNE